MRRLVYNLKDPAEINIDNEAAQKWLTTGGLPTLSAEVSLLK